MEIIGSSHSPSVREALINLLKLYYGRGSDTPSLSFQRFQSEKMALLRYEGAANGFAS